MNATKLHHLKINICPFNAALWLKYLLSHKRYLFAGFILKSVQSLLEHLMSSSLVLYCIFLFC